MAHDDPGRLEGSVDEYAETRSGTRSRYSRIVAPVIDQRPDPAATLPAEPEESATRAGSVPVMRIEPDKGWVPLRLHELRAYRELLLFMAWRDMKVRYRQTLLGVSWAILQPVLTMVVFTIFFGRLGKVPSDGLPYPIFAYAGLLPWTLFSNGVSASSNSLVGGANLIKKVYFPRFIFPVAPLLGAVVDFFLAMIVLVGMMVYYDIQPTIGVLLLPLFILLAWLCALGAGLWLSALNVLYRDIRYVVPFGLQLWLFITPLAYPSSLLKGVWRTVYAINPMAGVVEGFRWAITGSPAPPGAMLVVSSATALLLVVTGAYFFRRMERAFSDVV